METKASSPTASTSPHTETLRPVGREPHRQRISDRVYDSLSAAIRSLALPPGAVLSESDLAQRLAVSRTPLREALSRLADQGLVRVAPQVGTTVSLIDLDEVNEATFIRTSLEAAAYRLACERGGSVEGLRAILARQEVAVTESDNEAFFETDEELHQEIFRLAGFPHAWSVVRSSKMQLDRVRRLVLGMVISNRDVLDEHVAIVDRLERRDVVDGARLVSSHTQHVLDLIPGLQQTHPSYFTKPL